MTHESHTDQDSFKALLTGYGTQGDLDYVHFPAASVPEFSLKGDKPFTLFTTLCLTTMHGGSILQQKGCFRLGIMDGLLYVAAPDWCVIKFSEAKIGRLTTHRWYKLALVYDTHSLTIYLDGIKKEECWCTPAIGEKSKAELQIGERLDAYFRNFRIFDCVLSDGQVERLSQGEELDPQESIAWFDFDRTDFRDNSPCQVKLSAEACARIVAVQSSRQFRFNIDKKYSNVERMLRELFDDTSPLNVTGYVSRRHDGEQRIRLYGMFSLGTPRPIMCGVEGEVVTIWECADTEQE